MCIIKRRAGGRPWAQPRPHNPTHRRLHRRGLGAGRPARRGKLARKARGHPEWPGRARGWVVLVSPLQGVVNIPRALGTCKGMEGAEGSDGYGMGGMVSHHADGPGSATLLQRLKRLLAGWLCCPLPPPPGWGGVRPKKSRGRRGHFKMGCGGCNDTTGAG